MSSLTSNFNDGNKNPWSSSLLAYYQQRDNVWLFRMFFAFRVQYFQRV